jgi:putative SOS response-associated peptidase YedK
VDRPGRDGRCDWADDARKRIGGEDDDERTLRNSGIFFAEDITKHGCVIPEDDCFEWSSSKQPLIFKANSGDIVFLAGFYNSRKEFVILTRRAVGKLSAIHHGIRIVFTETQHAEWHSPEWMASCRPIQRI